MAKDTNLSLRQSVIYQVYNRNHNESGTFRELIGDLERIKQLIRSRYFIFVTDSSDWQER